MEEEKILESIFFDREQRVLANVSDEERNVILEIERDGNEDKLTGCCQEGQVHHTLSERLSTDAKVWSENGIDEMSQLRAFTQNGGNIY